MPSTRDEATQQLIEQAVEIAARHRGAGAPPGDGVAKLIGLYYRHVGPDDLRDRSPIDLYGAAVTHYRLAKNRPQGTSSLRVFTPTIEDSEWAAEGHTVIQVVTDDMPFLVDSITMGLVRERRGIHLVIHPQLAVRRDISGRLTEIGDPDRPKSGDDQDFVRESWMHLEIDKETDPEELAHLQEVMSHVLRDVRDAVEDWAKMHSQATAIVDDLTANPPPLPDAEVDETKALLRWLADDHFTFLGYREYVLQSEDGDDMLKAVPGTGLGILRADQDLSKPPSRLPAAVAAKARDKELLIITKANSRSTVHRPAYLDYIGIKTFDEQGEVVGERRFLGLFSSAAYTESLSRIPVLRDKMSWVLSAAGYTPDSHSGKALLDILETYPRDEMFQTPVDQLLPVAESVLHLRERRQLRFFTRRDPYGRYLSCLVYLPRDRYTTAVRQKMEGILTSRLGASSVDFTARVGDSVLARLHFVVRAEAGSMLQPFDEAELEKLLAAAAHSWVDDFEGAMVDQFGEQKGASLLRRYADSFPEAYKEDFPARVAAADVRRLEEIGDQPVGLSLYAPVDADENEMRFKVFREGAPLSLSQVLPVLTALGTEVTDERPYELRRRSRTGGSGDSARAWIYDFGLRYSGRIPDNARELFQDAFMAVWSNRAESDGFSALVLRAGLTWRQVTVLRAYAKYFRQGGSTFGQDYLEQALVANIDIAQLLVALFERRFDPRQTDEDARAEACEELEDRIEEALNDVASLDQDRILRGYLSVIKATLRTNYYQTAADGGRKTYISLKLEPREVPDLPEPRPMFEIFVYSPRVEGVHLRFGPVARGGLRWSDRRDDFRTEVLGLVKAQMVKNAVIVPVGSKGGFYCKQLPDPSLDREAWLAEGIDCYQTFISGLLDLTDNRVTGEKVPPPDVVRHDGDDSYLVVAADKGTATFSDIANKVARKYGFWLDDAFASGGSAGYDHKAMGITARGAWESVKRHFRERGIDCQTEDFTCVGIGDMSGDVFGNGMLLSEHTRLLAAFDHRHIFLDPDPDVATSYAERRRLFDLPRSSWADYDSELISAGGGVYPRTLKAIPVSDEAREALGITTGDPTLTPNELMEAILLAPVDLLWNGGIGTYVKASTESNADVGDRANDAIRVDGGALRCKAVGEGGNLGLTQLGRIEYARNGGRINTDAIDNSAGVDTSDHEVNIKILLGQVIEAGDMTLKQRNKLLASMTDEVAALVLADNYGQNVAIANSESQAVNMLHVHEDWIRRLERQGLLEPQIEYLPSHKQFVDRLNAGVGLSAPELSVLLAYTKIVLESELIESDLPDDAFLQDRLVRYFPTPMRERFAAAIRQHPLRREIIVTQVVNELVNAAGITFYHRVSQETGASEVDLVRAHQVCSQVYGSRELLEQIDALDNEVAAAIQTEMRVAVRTLVERASRWLVTNRRPPLDSQATADFFGDTVRTVMASMPDIMTGVVWKEFERTRKRLAKAGVPDDLAVKIAVLPPAYPLLTVVQIAKHDDVDPLQVARLHAALANRLGLGEFLAHVVALPRDDRWRTMARAALRDDLYGVHAQLTEQVIHETDADLNPGDRLSRWEHEHGQTVSKVAATLREIVSEDTDLARLSVGLRVVRSLLT
jgi:glutamate dehydrogenase